MDPVTRVRKGELVGLKVKIVASRNSSNIGKEGKVVDETRNMLVLKDDKEGIKRYIKEENTFEFISDKRKVRVKGSLLSKRPEDRILK